MKISKAVEDTIEYAAKFGSYINRKEIKDRLISKNLFSKKELDNYIRQLKYKNKKNKYIEGKFRKAAYLAQKIETNFKDVLFVGVSGSVATGHPKINDDIDFLIITKSNKLWQTRFGLRWWIFKNRIPHRKYGEKEKKDEFCFNLWLDENHLLLPKEKQNLNNSVDLILLKPLINKNHTYEKFFLINSWAEKWVATPYSRLSACQTVSLSVKTENKKLDKFINCLYFWPQYWYMKRKINKETVGLYQAFFHQ